MRVLATLAVAGLAGCGIQSGFNEAEASPSSTRQGPCRAGDSGAGARAHCAVADPEALQQSNETYLQRLPVPAAQVAAAQPLRRRVQRGLRALTPSQRLRPGAVKGALVAAGLPAAVYLLPGNPIAFSASPWQNKKLCIYGDVTAHQVDVYVAGITEDGSCLPAPGNG